MNRQKRFSSGLLTLLFSLALLFAATDTAAVCAAENAGDGEIDKQIEYMLLSAKQLRQKVLAADTTAPEILGLSEFVVKVGDNLSYKRGVTVQDDSGRDIACRERYSIDTQDDSGRDVSLVIDNSQVNLSQLGTYVVIYSATDLSGNTTTVEVPVTVIEGDPVDPQIVYDLADKLIADLLTEDMALQDKVFKLWNWCRTKIKYSYSAGARTVYEAAYEGLYGRKGDCYIYYATMEVLLDRLGVENMKVARVGGVSNHWWNLVNLGDGWYHCDASPRQKGDPYLCFMQTDEQLAKYTVYYEATNPGHPNYFTFDETLYPERETTIIYDGKMRELPQEQTQEPAPQPTP